MSEKRISALVFLGVFSLLMAFVFWGTWSFSFVPVMPDSPIAYPLSYGTRVSHWFSGWCQNGRFIPTDLHEFFVSPFIWHEGQYVLGTFFAALGMAYFLRGRGLSPIAAFGGGLFLAFSGYWLTLFSAGHGSWFIWMTYGVFVFGLCDRAIRKSRLRHWFLLGAVLAWASFWQVDLWLLFSEFAFAYFVWCCVRERKWPSWKGLCLAALAFAVVGMPSFIDAFSNALSGRDKQIAESKGTVLGSASSKNDDETRWVFVTNWSMPPEDTLEFFIPRIHGDTSCQMTLALSRRSGKDVAPYTGRLGRPMDAAQGNYRQHSLYVGWMTCLLALVGTFLGVRRRRGEVVFFCVAALVFWLFSMGRFCAPVYRLVYALPFGDYLRAPVKWHHLTEFSLVVLAGYGLAMLGEFQWVKGRSGKLILAALVVIGAFDLARVARLYCAPMDISLVSAENPAAQEVVRRGGGKVVDLCQGGYGPAAWSFSAREVEVTGNPADQDARFAWLPVQQSVRPEVVSWLKSRHAKKIGAYSLTSRDMRSVPDDRANVLLLEFPDAPRRKIDESKPLRLPVVAWGVFSLFGSIWALMLAAFPQLWRSRRL